MLLRKKLILKCFESSKRLRKKLLKFFKETTIGINYTEKVDCKMNDYLFDFKEEKLGLVKKKLFFTETLNRTSEGFSFGVLNAALQRL